MKNPLVTDFPECTITYIPDASELVVFAQAVVEPAELEPLVHVQAVAEFVVMYFHLAAFAVAAVA